MTYLCAPDFSSTVRPSEHTYGRDCGQFDATEMIFEVAAAAVAARKLMK